MKNVSTMCCHCAPAHLLDFDGEVVDHGFNLPDTREQYHIYSDDEVVGSVSVSIKRKWGECDCGSGEAVMTGLDWVVSGPDCTVTVPDGTDTFALIKVIWPDAAEPEYDAAWESERNLRIAEGWGF